MKIIAISNQKGGTGKSSSCIEICSILGRTNKPKSRQKYRVLAIDMDQQRNFSIYCGADVSKPSIYDALHGNKPVTECIQHVDTYDVIISSNELSKADREFVDRDDVYLLEDLLKFVENDYDYVVIDNSPSRNILLSMVYVASDYILIPTEADHGSIVEGIGAVYTDVNKLRSGRNQISHAKIMGLILTKYEDTVLHSLALDDLQAISDNMTEDTPFIATIRKSIVVSECKRVFESLQTYAVASKPADDYRNLVKLIVRNDK